MLSAATDSDISALAAVSPKPMNLFINSPFITVSEAADLGVRRISVERALARTVWAGILEGAHEIVDDETFFRFRRLPNVDELFHCRDQQPH